jgi:hypothetical protein
MSTDAAKAVVRWNTEEVQNRGNFDAFEEHFADDFIDHTPQPGTTPDKAGVRKLYSDIRAAFPDFHAEIHWQLADGDRVMGLGERYELSAAQEFPAGSFLVVPKKVPHFALCKGETIVQGHGTGPLDTTLVRPEDDPRKETK